MSKRKRPSPPKEFNSISEGIKHFYEKNLEGYIIVDNITYYTDGELDYKKCEFNINEV